MTEDVVKKEYEISFLGKDEAASGKAAELITRLGGEIYLQSPVERIALEYKIEHLPGAYFGYFHFRMTPAQAEELRRDLRVQAPVMRSLVITPPPAKAKPRPLRPKAPGASPTPSPMEAPVRSAPAAERKPEGLPLSNEALEKKIEEILNQ